MRKKEQKKVPAVTIEGTVFKHINEFDEDPGTIKKRINRAEKKGLKPQYYILPRGYWLPENSLYVREPKKNVKKAEND